MSSAGTERRRWAQLCGVMSVGSALESSASQFDHESVTACCCDTVSLSCTSVQKVSPVKPKPASPRPKRWPKHSATAAKSPQGRGERRNLSISVISFTSQSLSVPQHRSLLVSALASFSGCVWNEAAYIVDTEPKRHSIEQPKSPVLYQPKSATAILITFEFSLFRNTQSSLCTVANVEKPDYMFWKHRKSEHNWNSLYYSEKIQGVLNCGHLVGQGVWPIWTIVNVEWEKSQSTTCMKRRCFSRSL